MLRIKGDFSLGRPDGASINENESDTVIIMRTLTINNSGTVLKKKNNSRTVVK